MLEKETWAERAERLMEEARQSRVQSGKSTVQSPKSKAQSLKSKVHPPPSKGLRRTGSSGAEEWVQKRLRWEDWETLLPELIECAKGEIARRRWRGSKVGVLPEGFDANSVASEVVMRALQGEARLAPGWTRERLVKELMRKVSNEVRRLHKLMETRAMRSEWDVLLPLESGALRSVLAKMPGGAGGWDDGQVRDKVRKETEQRIAEALRGGDQAVEKLFGCLRAGVVKRREIAARLGMSLTEVTNCRKRLDRTLDELKKAGCAGWAIAEWKRK
jgi:hypothetical protein